MPGESTQARCLACGGSIPLQLHDPLECPYCHAIDAVEPRLRQKIHAVRDRLARRERKVRQFKDQEHVFSQAFFSQVTKHFPLLVILWLLVGGIVWGTAQGFLDDASPWDIVTGALPVVEEGPQMVFSLLFPASFVGVFTFGLPLVGLLGARAVMREARPLAPASSGAPPRCRCCLADLPAQGMVRRCAYCGADHLVLDDRYRAEQASLDRVVFEALSEGAKSLQERIERVEKLVSWSLASVVFSLAILPFAGGLTAAVLEVFEVVPSHEVFWLPASLGVVAFAVYVVVRARVRRLNVEPAAAPAPAADQGPPPLPRGG